MVNLKKKNVESGIFTGSMADISFLLIIYFMLTSVFSATRGLDFALPEENPQQQEIKQEDAIDVHITATGALEVDGKGMSLEQLLPYVGEKLKQAADKPVILRTDPEASYGAMVEVFDELRQSEDKIGMKIETISIPTQREIQNVWALLGVE